MRGSLLPVAAAIFTLVGCASQTSESQLTRRDTVRVCQAGHCVDQSTDKVTFQSDAVDPQALQRLQALTHLAESDARAAYDLGLRLLRGDGVQRDSYQGVQWLRKAGDQGLAAAQLALGQLYLTGLEEMGPDPAEAEAWLSRAASQGNATAQQLLAEAQTAKLAARESYEFREAERKYRGHWYHAAPYYWQWHNHSWHRY